MTPLQIEQVFGRGRLKMATGEHVEVFREAIIPGERRRYTKRFLTTHDGDFGPWTEREWRILARLIGHGIRCVPDVVQFDGGALGGARLVQTYDAGITVDQWGTLLPVARRGEAYRHVFEDCAHWWSLAHHCLSALDEIHALGLVHLDIKGDNICIPYGPADFDPNAPSMHLRPEFGRLALIDFAFSLVSRESLAMPLPIGWQKDYDYQSPRLLRALDAGRNGDLEPTRELDWRCDLYSLAAMLKRYLPPAGDADEDGRETGWTVQRYDDARTLIFRLRDSHDRELPHWRPHGQFIDYASARLDAPELARSLAEGWSLERDTATVGIATPMTAITPMTRIAPMLRTARRGRDATQSARSTTPGDATGRSARIAAAASTRAVSPEFALTAVTAVSAGNWDLSSGRIGMEASSALARRVSQRALPAWILVGSLVAVASPSFIGNPEQPLAARTRELLAELRLPFDRPAEDVARRAVVPPAAAVPAEPAANADVDRRPGVESAGVTESSAPASSGDGVADVASMPAAAPASADPVAAAPELGLGSVASKGTNEPVALPRINQRPPSNAPTAGEGPAARTPEAPRANVAQASPSHSAAQGRTPAKRAPSGSGKAAGVPSKQYADAARRPPPHVAAATRDRVAMQQTPRIALAASTPRTPPPSHGVPSTSAAGRPASESAAQTAAPSTGEAIAQGESGTKDREAIASGSGAGASPTTAVSAASKASETPIASSGSPSTQSTARAEPRADWRNQLVGFLALFKDRATAPAPVEDRTIPQPGNRPTAASRALARSATDAITRAAVGSSAAAATPSPATSASAPQTLAPLKNTLPQDAPPPAMVALASEPMAQQATPAAALSTPDRYVAATANVPASRPLSETRYVPAPRNVAAPRDYPRDDAQELAAQARRLLIDTVPRVAAQAGPEVSRVLSAAAISHHPAQARLVIAAADGPWPSESAWIAVTETKPAYARRLHDEARRAAAAGGDIADAVNAELQAFGANPRDPDIGGYLALLYLRMNPSRPELARQLALHAIVQSGSRRSTRAAEWNTFAVASALTGREEDAARAFLTEAAFTTNVDRSCQSALSAYANYGEPLRAPVLALLQRVNAQGRAYSAPSCTWPAYWSAAARAGISY